MAAELRCPRARRCVVSCYGRSSPRLQLAGYTQHRRPLPPRLRRFRRPLPALTYRVLVLVCVDRYVKAEQNEEGRCYHFPPGRYHDFRGKKVCRRTGDVSSARLSHLLPGCMTEGILGTLSYAYGVKRREKIQRTRLLLARLRHVVPSLKSQWKAMRRALRKETRSAYPSATFSHVIRLSSLPRSDGALPRSVISAHDKPVFSRRVPTFSPFIDRNNILDLLGSKYVSTPWFQLPLL